VLLIIPIAVVTDKGLIEGKRWQWKHLPHPLLLQGLEAKLRRRRRRRSFWPLPHGCLSLNKKELLEFLCKRKNMVILYFIFLWSWCFLNQYLPFFYSFCLFYRISDSEKGTDFQTSDQQQQIAKFCDSLSLPVCMQLFFFTLSFFLIFFVHNIDCTLFTTIRVLDL